MSSAQEMERRRINRRKAQRRKAEAAVPTGAWSDLHRPLRILVYVLIAAVLIQVYHQTEYIAAKIFDVLLLFVFAAIVAMLLTPLVDRIQEYPPLQQRRAMAVLILNLLLTALLAGFLAILIPSVAAQGSSLGHQIPQLMGQLRDAVTTVESWLNARGIPVHLAIPTNVESLIAPALGSALQIVTGVLGGLINLLLIVVISIYLQIQGREMVAALRQVFPHQQAWFDFALVTAGSTLAGYVRGQVIFAAILAVATGVVLAVLGVHFALVIAVITFFLELIPLVGAPIAMVLAVAIALLQGPVVTVETLGATVLLHGVLAYTVGMKVVGDATRVHPLVAMLALVLGAQVGGVLGALFAIPIAGILNVYLGALYRARRGEEAFTLPPEGHPAPLDHLPNLGAEITQLAEEETITREPIPTAVPKEGSDRARRPSSKTTGGAAAPKPEAKASGS
jgi:predicted PurR-regulated permease PerM